MYMVVNLVKLAVQKAVEAMQVMEVDMLQPVQAQQAQGWVLELQPLAVLRQRLE
jgi:hypothetical protein